MMSSMSCVIVLTALISPAAGVALSTIDKYAGNTTGHYKNSCDEHCCVCERNGVDCDCRHKTHGLPEDCKDPKYAEILAAYLECIEEVKWGKYKTPKAYNKGPPTNALLTEAKWLTRFRKIDGKARTLKKFKETEAFTTRNLERLCGPDPRTMPVMVKPFACGGFCRYDSLWRPMEYHTGHKITENGPGKTFDDSLKQARDDMDAGKCVPWHLGQGSGTK